MAFTSLDHQRTRRAWLAGCALGMSALGIDGWASDRATSRWPYEVSAGMFRIHADFEITPASDFVGELNKLVTDVGGMLSTPQPTSTMHMVLFERSEEYRRYLDHYFPKLPERRALFIRQRGTAMLFAHRHPDMATDLRHESVHALMNDAQYSLPLWLDEGLAEYFEVPKERRWSGHVHLREIKQSISSGPPDLSALERLEGVSDMTAEHYRDAWAWVHFLMHRRYTTRQLLVDQIDTRRRARPVLPVSRIVELQIPKWRAEIVEHFTAVATAEEQP